MNILEEINRVYKTLNVETISVDSTDPKSQYKILYDYVSIGEQFLDNNNDITIGYVEQLLKNLAGINWEKNSEIVTFTFDLILKIFESDVLHTEILSLPVFYEAISVGLKLSNDYIYCILTNFWYDMSQKFVGNDDKHLLNVNFFNSFNSVLERIHQDGLRNEAKNSKVVNFILNLYNQVLENSSVTITQEFYHIFPIIANFLAYPQCFAEVLSFYKNGYDLMDDSELSSLLLTNESYGKTLRELRARFEHHNICDFLLSKIDKSVIFKDNVNISPRSSIFENLDVLVFGTDALVLHRFFLDLTSQTMSITRYLMIQSNYKVILTNRLYAIFTNKSRFKSLQVEGQILLMEILNLILSNCGTNPLRGFVKDPIVLNNAIDLLDSQNFQLQINIVKLFYLIEVPELLSSITLSTFIDLLYDSFDSQSDSGDELQRTELNQMLLSLIASSFNKFQLTKLRNKFVSTYPGVFNDFAEKFSKMVFIGYKDTRESMLKILSYFMKLEMPIDVESVVTLKVFFDLDTEEAQTFYIQLLKYYFEKSGDHYYFMLHPDIIGSLLTIAQDEELGKVGDYHAPLRPRVSITSNLNRTTDKYGDEVSNPYGPLKQLAIETLNFIIVKTHELNSSDQFSVQTVASLNYTEAVLVRCFQDNQCVDSCLKVVEVMSKIPSMHQELMLNQSLTKNIMKHFRFLNDTAASIMFNFFFNRVNINMHYYLQIFVGSCKLVKAMSSIARAHINDNDYMIEDKYEFFKYFLGLTAILDEINYVQQNSLIEEFSKVSNSMANQLGKFSRRNRKKIANTKGHKIKSLTLTVFTNRRELFKFVFLVLLRHVQSKNPTDPSVFFITKFFKILQEEFQVEKSLLLEKLFLKVVRERIDSVVKYAVCNNVVTYITILMDTYDQFQLNDHVAAFTENAVAAMLVCDTGSNDNGDGDDGDEACFESAVMFKIHVLAYLQKVVSYDRMCEKPVCNLLVARLTAAADARSVAWNDFLVNSNNELSFQFMKLLIRLLESSSENRALLVEHLGLSLASVASIGAAENRHNDIMSHSAMNKLARLLS